MGDGFAVRSREEGLGDGFVAGVDLIIGAAVEGEGYWRDGVGDWVVEEAVWGGWAVGEAGIAGVG